MTQEKQHPHSCSISRREFCHSALLAGTSALVGSLALANFPKNAIEGEAPSLETADLIEFAGVTFDLSVSEKQDQTIILPDGTEATICIEPAPSTRGQSLGNGYGDWKVSYYTVVLNTYFWVRVDNYAITRAYGEFAGSFDTPGTHIVIDWTNLDWGPTWSRLATRYHDSAFGTYATRFLEGNISGTQLVTNCWVNNG